jgi:type IV pilus assembly protein PilC
MSARKFKYVGFDRSAKPCSGVIEASSQNDALQKLRELSIRPTKIIGSKSGGKAKAGGDDVMAMLGLAPSGKPPLAQFAAFCRQLSTMQSAGIPIMQGLGILAEQAETPAFGTALLKIQKRIEEGTSLTDALREYPQIFDRIFINLVSAGEMSGSLESVLTRLAVYYEKSAALKRKIVSASAYPIMILVAMVGVLFVLLTFVVPTFAEMFASGGKELPGPTQVLLRISHGIRDNMLLVVAGIVGFFGGLYACFTNEKLKRELDPILLKLPIFGGLIQKVGVARFSRTLSTMIQSGVPIIEALEITSRVAGNSVIEAAIRKTKTAISSGNTIAGPLGKSKVFPKMVVSMIAIGEQTGTLDALLMKIAEFYEDEVDNAVSALVSILEPLMIIIVGLVIGAVLIPLYLPVFSMAELG